MLEVSTSFLNFAKAIEAAYTREEAFLKIGYHTKTTIEELVFVKEANSASSDRAWMQFFTKVSKILPSFVPVRTIGRDEPQEKRGLNRDNYDYILDNDLKYIRDSILGMWSKNKVDGTKSGNLNTIRRKLAFACYYYLHVSEDELLTSAARNIDRKIIGQAFEDVFGMAVPNTNDQALMLEKRIEDVRAALDEATGIPSVALEVEKQPADIHPSTHVNSTTEATRQPRLSPPIRTNNPHHHAYRLLDKVLWREQEEADLRNFLANTNDFKWLQISGVSGQGKSRLASDLGSVDKVAYLRRVIATWIETGNGTLH